MTKGDDYPIHQTPDPIAFSGTDRNFYDRSYFNAHDRTGEHPVEQRDRAQLRDRLHHQHTRQRGPAREVPGEEPLVAGQPPQPRGRLPGNQLGHLVDEQERGSVGQDVRRLADYCEVTGSVLS